ncbi:quinolinate synthase NadA [Thermodesulfitimonas autotrophica]|uniref:quinolinate synthase NadA n=1 Tax=Thermodesulfitimonas autotrophica TaxID=1894989 RepID=UPI002FE27248
MGETGAALSAAIKRLKEEREALILSHYYQRPEIQDIADFIGDSLELSRRAATTAAKVLVFCGVHFMAETAAILSPKKVVLIPDPNAGCPLAEMITPDALRARKAELHGAVVVAYVNTTAAVKAESDIVCTSANAARVVRSLPPEKHVLFVPDRNLGLYAAAQNPDRKIIFWEGYCPIHDQMRAEDILRAKQEHPAAEVIAHPECRPEVLALADKVASTSGMLRYAFESAAREFIVVTEEGLLHQLRRQNPEKKFHLASPRLVCPNMKRTTLDKVYRALRDLAPRVTVPENVRERAVQAVERMLALG